jgi:hypothetical protein
MAVATTRTVCAEGLSDFMKEAIARAVGAMGLSDFMKEAMARAVGAMGLSDSMKEAMARAAGVLGLSDLSTAGASSLTTMMRRSLYGICNSSRAPTRHLLCPERDGCNSPARQESASPGIARMLMQPCVPYFGQPIVGE